MNKTINLETGVLIVKDPCHKIDKAIKVKPGRWLFSDDDMAPLLMHEEEMTKENPVYNDRIVEIAVDSGEIGLYFDDDEIIIKTFGDGFHSVILFSCNDEVVHVGISKKSDVALAMENITIN